MGNGPTPAHAARTYTRAMDAHTRVQKSRSSKGGASHLNGISRSRRSAVTPQTWRAVRRSSDDAMLAAVEGALPSGADLDRVFSGTAAELYGRAIGEGFGEALLHARERVVRAAGCMRARKNAPDASAAWRGLAPPYAQLPKRRQPVEGVLGNRRDLVAVQIPACARRGDASTRRIKKAAARRGAARCGRA